MPASVSAQSIKTDETPGAPAAQQNAPAEKMAPAVKSDQSKTPEKTGQAAPTVPDNKQQTTDKGAPAGAAAKGSSEADGSAVVKSKRAERHGGPDMQVATMDRYITATEAIMATEIAATTVITGCPG